LQVIAPLIDWDEEISAKKLVEEEQPPKKLILSYALRLLKQSRYYIQQLLRIG